MSQFERLVPPGDNRERDVCRDCGHIDYQNPKVVVGAVCEFEGQVLLCRRDIEPRRGFWTIPAGYMELGETTEEGARREVREEAEADVELTGLIGCYSIPRIGQVLLIYRGTLRDGVFAAGDETSEAKLVAYDAIEWESLAFPSVRWALEDWAALQGEVSFAPRSARLADVSQPLPASGPLPSSTSRATSPGDSADANGASLSGTSSERSGTEAI